MNDISSDDIFLLKQRLAEQEALIHALQEKLSNREREIDHLQAQLDKLRRMNFGSRSEKVSRRIAQMEADLNRLQKESDTLTGRVYDPAVQRPLRQTRTRKPFPESLPRDEKRLLPAAPCCPNCGGSLSYLGEDTAEQLELMRSAFRVIRTVREKHACTQCDAIVQAPAPSRPIERGIAGPGMLALVLTSKYAEHTPLYRQSEIYGRQGVELSRSLLSGWVDACCRLLSPLEEALHGYVMTDGKLHADDTPVQVLMPGNSADSSCLLQRCAASGCVRRVQRAVSQWWDNGSCLLGSCPPKDPRCARPHPVSTDGRSPGADRSVVRHRGGYKGNAGRAAAC